MIKILYHRAAWAYFEWAAREMAPQHHDLGEVHTLRLYHRQQGWRFYQPMRRPS